MSAFTIKSEITQTHSPLDKLFDFISDFKNLDTILPHDKIEDFKYNGDECSFNIKGIAAMKIKMAEKRPHEFILFSSNGLSKFNFDLKVFFIGNASDKGECRIELVGDLNPFIKVMAEKPLTKLVNTMAHKLAELELEK
ncbi:MAG: hypothetical protein JWO32_1588 [Bacteroidetes bacterium]|nr:hypothetical protein [Bacteroidota bacterium]